MLETPESQIKGKQYKFSNCLPLICATRAIVNLAFESKFLILYRLSAKLNINRKYLSLSIFMMQRHRKSSRLEPRRTIAIYRRIYLKCRPRESRIKSQSDI